MMRVSSPDARTNICKVTEFSRTYHISVYVSKMVFSPIKKYRSSTKLTENEDKGLGLSLKLVLGVFIKNNGVERARGPPVKSRQFCLTKVHCKISV